MKPVVSKYFNLFVEGVGFIGKVEEFTPPNINTKKAEAPMGYKIDVGIPEAPEAEVKLYEINKVYYDAMAKADEAKFVIKEQIIDNGTCKTLVHTMVGSFDLEFDGTKSGEGKATTLKLYPQRYTKEIDGKEAAFVDVTVPIMRLNGKDIVEEMRNAIG